jgi:membrane-bound lytic murein transglycosylase B
MRDYWPMRGMLLAGVAALTVACAAEPSHSENVPNPPPLAVDTTAPSGAPAATQDFVAFLQGVKAEAATKGVRPETAAVLDGVQFIPRIIELDRRQPEFTLTFDQYLHNVVNPQRVAKGRKMLAENREVLAAIQKRYGVQPRFVVAMWGIETDFGRVTGSYPVVTSLSTLAWDGRRSAYFRGELIAALQILDQGHVRPAAMIGSWAGAMGQCQFMPTTFLKFAQDFDGDGRRDIWTSRPDVLASAANYLSSLGWKGDESWGRAVRLPARFNLALAGLDRKKTLAEWARLGVRGADGKALPKRAVEASLVLADGKVGPPFLVYDNFRAVMKWNRSTFFALAAGHLADSIGHR